MKIACLKTPSGLLIPLHTKGGQEIAAGRAAKRRKTEEELRGAYLMRNIGPEKLAEQSIRATQEREQREREKAAESTRRDFEDRLTHLQRTLSE